MEDDNYTFVMLIDGTQMSYNEYIEKIKEEDGEDVARHTDALLQKNLMETEMRINKEFFGSASV